MFNSQRSQCHADGIALGLFNIHYTKLTVQANWFIAKVKVKYLEFGMGQVNEIEDDAFNADAFRSVKHLVFTQMDLIILKKGLLNGLESLEILNLKESSLIQSVDMGIIDEMHKTLRELTIERPYARKVVPLHSGTYETHPLPIHSFSGSQQASNLEFMRIRYYLQRLTSKSFVALKNNKHLDLSKCGIEYVEEGTFDAVINTVKVIRLIDNPLQQLPASMFHLIPLRYETYIYVGENQNECVCENFPINLIVKVKCSVEVDECNSFVLTKRTTNLTEKSTSTTLSSSYTKGDVSVGESKSTSETNNLSTIVTSSSDLIAASTSTESTVNKINDLEMLPTAELQTQTYSQYFSKHTYLLFIGVVAVILPLLLFLVWFNCFKQNRPPRAQEDFDLVLL